MFENRDACLHFCQAGQHLSNIGVSLRLQATGVDVPGDAVKVVGQRQRQQGTQSQQGDHFEAFFAYGSVNCLELRVVLR